MTKRYHTVFITEQRGINRAAYDKLDDHLKQLSDKAMSSGHYGYEPDEEDFIEDIVRIDAAIKNFGAENVYFGNSYTLTGRNMATGEESKLGSFDGVFLLGGEPKTAPNRPEDQYWKYNSVKRAMKRNVEEVALMSDDGSMSGEKTVLEMINASKDGLVLKRIGKKLPISVVPKVISDLEEMRNWIMEELFIWMEESYIAQDKLTMRYERRFFVVGGEIISHAGCIEEDHPLLGTFTGNDVTKRSREDRSVISGVLSEVSEITEDQLNSMIDFVNGIIPDFISEMRRDIFVIDVALDENDDPLVVELNKLGSSGFYCNDAYGIIQAVSELPKVSEYTVNGKVISVDEGYREEDDWFLKLPDKG